MSFFPRVDEVRIPMLRSCAAHMMSGLSATGGASAARRPLPGTERSESQESGWPAIVKEFTHSATSGRPGRDDEGKREKVEDRSACNLGGGNTGVAATPQSGGGGGRE